MDFDRRNKQVLSILLVNLASMSNLLHDYQLLLFVNPINHSVIPSNRDPVISLSNTAQI